jgi:dihydrofolate reductase
MQVDRTSAAAEPGQRSLTFCAERADSVPITTPKVTTGTCVGGPRSWRDGEQRAYRAEAICSPAQALARLRPGPHHHRSIEFEESTMSATYTVDVFSSLDGFGAASGDWTGYWGKQGPELLDHRLALYSEEQHMVFGATTFRATAAMLASGSVAQTADPWVTRMWNLPATVVSTTLDGTLGWPHAIVESGDAVDVVARLKEESAVPLRSHGSLSMNRALMAAGLVDRIQVTLFPVITGRSGVDPVFAGAADFDLDLLETRTLDGYIQELVYRPTLHA